MDDLKAWSAQKWVFLVGLILCGLEWVQFFATLVGRRHFLDPDSHRVASEVVTISGFMMVLSFNKRGRWLVPLLGALLFRTVFVLCLRFIR